MAMENLITTEQFCTSHEIEISFIDKLQEFGLVQVEILEHTSYISIHELQKLEQVIHLHFELDINLEGIEAILHILQRENILQREIMFLENRLRLYEDL